MSRLLILILPLLFCAQAEAVRWRKARGPLYWSGTNCRAGGSQANISAGEVGIHLYEVRVNGTVVYSGPKDGETTGSCSGGATFDSTHFAPTTNGSPTVVEVRTYAKAKRDDGTITGWQDDGGYTAVVKNSSAIASILAHPMNFQFTLDGQTTTIGKIFTMDCKAKFEEMNYATNWLRNHQPDSQPWSPSDLYTGSNPCNLVAILSHGREDEAAVLASQSIDEPECTLVKPSLWAAQKASVFGTGVAPNNTGGIPPFNLLFLMSCKQGNFQSWSNVLVPGYPMGVNQAVLSFKPYMTTAAATTMPLKLFGDYMSHGFPLKTAIDTFIESEDTELYCADSPGIDKIGTGSVLRSLALDDRVIFGDPNMKLHGVYTNSDVPTPDWFK